MFDFALLPPEINSGRMYSGAGAGPLLSAAAAWDGLSAELHSAAVSSQSVITELTGSGWSGPSSVTMAASVAPHVTWLATTAMQAEQTAMQARAAAAAYETAFAMTVPPPVIAANRSLLAALVATNFLGQNTPAILATEAHYAEMWAQDAVAMYGYAGASAASSTLTPFTESTTQTNPAGPAAAAAQAAGTSAGTHAQTLTQLTAALHALASPAAAATTDATGTTATAGSSSIMSTLTTVVGLGPTGLRIGLMGFTFLIAGVMRGMAGAAAAAKAAAAAAAAAASSTVSTGLGSGAGAVLAGAPMSAGIGGADLVGKLSVPPAWTAATPATDVARMAAVPASASAPLMGVKGLYTGMGVAGLAGLGAGGGTRMIQSRQGKAPASQPATAPVKTKVRPAADTAGKPREGGAATKTPAVEIAARLRKFAALIDSGTLTDEAFDERKRLLLGR